MKLTQIRLERAQNPQGACCDRSAGPKVLQMTVKDEESGRRYYCDLSDDGGQREFVVAGRDVMHAIANMYDEDVIPWRLEYYRLDRSEERERLEQSAFYSCYLALEREENSQCR